MLPLVGCLTYYERTIAIDAAFQRNQYDKAMSQLNKSPINKKKRNKLLFYLNAGAIAFNSGDYVSSNGFFENAYTYIEDAEKRNIRDVYAYITNPMMTDYAGENHEILLIHYYKALNYLKMNQLAEALVEVRRMDNKLKRLNTLYRSENKYKEDAFINLLMGIVYEASNDNNNAFIAYRNAYECYKGVYSRLFGLTPPYQLKVDLIRSAYKTGFVSDGQRYEKQFGIKYVPEPTTNATFIALWHNGMAPVKAENSVTFSSSPGSNGFINVTDPNGGFTYSFPAPSSVPSSNQFSSFRIALPTYKARPSFYNYATLAFDSNTSKPLELAEDIAQIAPQCLHDRLVKDLSQTFARLAIKKASEYGLREAAKAQSKSKSKNAENAAAILDVAAIALQLFNTTNEKADTRNWQLLPSSISYTRFSLPAGSHTLKFKASGKLGDITINDTIGLQSGSYSFHTFTSSATAPGNY